MKELHATCPEWSIATLCHVLDVARSSFYYESERRQEIGLREAISRIAGEWPRYGSERITAQLKREEITFRLLERGEFAA